MSKEYVDLRQKYDKAAAMAKNGDKQALADKGKMMVELRQMERESAKSGKVLNPVARNGRVEVEVAETDTKQSLQEEYVRKFDGKVPVEIENRRAGTKFVGTLQKFHRSRLFAGK